MPADETTLTLAMILTAGGAVAAAALVTGIVALLKQLGTFLNGRERVTAFVLSAVLVGVAFAAGLGDGSLTLNPGSAFAGFLAWYAVARLSMAVYADVSGEANGLRGPQV